MKHAGVPDLQTNIAILGAGPTGLGAAWRMSQRAQAKQPLMIDRSTSLPFLLLDEQRGAGGRAASATTPEGFIFDYGGHVLFPHAEYPEFIDLLDEVIPEWHTSVPERYVWMGGKMLPTPVQRNIHKLPVTTMVECLWGLARRQPHTGSEEPHLAQHLQATFGKTLAHHVMKPLNHKMWAHQPEHLGSAWSSHRSGSKEANIPQVSIRNVLRNWLLRRDERGWTADTKVRYPLHGGSGAIWDGINDGIPGENKLYGKRAVALDSRNRCLLFEDGTSLQYKKLVTSIPLDSLLRLILDQPELQQHVESFRLAKVQILGFGIEGPMPNRLRGVHAINVPDPAIPFWRINVPSNFSPGNVPDASKHWSILCESSLHPTLQEPNTPQEVETILRSMKLIPAEAKVVSVFSTTLKHGYPVPFAGRDRLLNIIQPVLESCGIYSRGRFGGWRYEVSNQDHAFMQGVEVIDRLVHGTPETTYRSTWNSDEGTEAVDEALTAGAAR